jgi:enoyl-CoA hydratase/carnithine racemase
MMEQRELDQLLAPLATGPAAPANVDETPSGADLRLAEAQLLGWLDGLLKGLQTEEAVRQAHRIAVSAPLAVRAMKATMRGDLLTELPAALDREVVEQTKLLGTKDNEAGVTASLNRTRPAFTGE